MTKYQTIYCHGWSSGPAVWQYIAREPVSAPTFHEVTDAAGFLSALLVAAPDAPHVVIGWSMGGMVAQEYAATRPRDLKALVLIGSTPKFVSSDPEAGWPKKAIDQMATRLKAFPGTTLKAFQKAMFPPSERAAFKTYRKEFSDDTASDFSPGTLAAGLQYLAEKDLTVSLDLLECPVLWIHGTEDSICPPGCLSALPDTHQVAMIDGAGHAPHWSQPSQVNQLITEFLHDI